jgi:hypothetical protein
MPHFGLMEEKKLGPLEGPYQRARLHIRGGRRRLRQGKISAGIVTLYDAVTAAMEWYVASTERKAMLTIHPGEDLRDEKVLFSVLVRSKILGGSLDFGDFSRLTERALHEEMAGFDYSSVLKNVEALMLQLGIMPFDESALPPEDPQTY